MTKYDEAETVEAFRVLLDTPVGGISPNTIGILTTHANKIEMVRDEIIMTDRTSALILTEHLSRLRQVLIFESTYGAMQMQRMMAMLEQMKIEARG